MRFYSRSDKFEPSRLEVRTLLALHSVIVTTYAGRNEVFSIAATTFGNWYEMVGSRQKAIDYCPFLQPLNRLLPNLQNGAVNIAKRNDFSTTPNAFKSEFTE